MNNDDDLHTFNEKLFALRLDTYYLKATLKKRFTNCSRVTLSYRFFTLGEYNDYIWLNLQFFSQTKILKDYNSTNLSYAVRAINGI